MPPTQCIEKFSVQDNGFSGDPGVFSRIPIMPVALMKLGLIAGNGRFPFLLLDAARAQGFAVTVAAIREETDPEINQRAAADGLISVHWLSLGELSSLIEVFHKEGVSKAVMAGQVRHKQIFSSIRPDWRLAKLASFGQPRP